MVTIENLSVSYGKVRALHDLTLSIPGRGVFGLLGRNGAGKTTTIRSILGLVSCDSGRVLVSGLDPCRERSVRRKISVLFSEDGLIPAMTAGDNLSVWAGLFGFGGRERSDLVSSVLDRFEITDLSRKTVRDLSTGNRRIVALARTFMLEADMYILDEPTASLDPVRAEEIRGLIAGLSGSRSVLLSTHNLHEAEELSDEVAIIDEGRLIARGRPGEMGREDDRYLVRCETWPLLYRGGQILPGDQGYAVIESPDPAPDVLGELMASGNRITEFRQLRKTLSDVFLSVTAGGDVS